MYCFWLFLEYKGKLEQCNSFQIESEVQIASYYNIRQQLDRLGLQFRSYLTKSNYLIPFLQPGRLVKVSEKIIHQVIKLFMIVFK